MLNRSQRYRYRLLSEDPSSMTLMSRTMCLFGHEIGDHIGGRDEQGLDITPLGMVTAEMILHIDVTSSGLVGGMKGHG